jgi:hypothetical protein
VVIERTLDEAMAARRNHRFDVVDGQMIEDGVGVVSLVGSERIRLQILQRCPRLRAVAGLAAGEGEAGQRSQPLDQGVNLGAQSAARSPQRLVTLFWCARGMQMRPHDGAVDEHLVEVRILGQRGEDLMPYALARPPGETLVDAVPGAELARQIAPGTAGSRDPQHGLDKQPVIGRRTARIAHLARQQRLDSLELIIPQPTRTILTPPKSQDMTVNRTG